MPPTVGSIQLPPDSTGKKVKTIVDATDATLHNPTTVIVDEAGSPVAPATEATVGKRFGGGKVSYAAVLTASGSITPAVGKAVRVSWVAFIPNPDNLLANLVTIKFNGAANALYIGYAMAHWEQFTGTTNQVLDITLATIEPVALTIHYEEITL